MNTLQITMIGLAGLCAAGVAAPAVGEPTPSSQLYYLRAKSTDQEGCFGACLCPVWLPQPMRGTFVLTPTSSDPMYQDYTITGVQWQSPFFARTLEGSGTYRVGGEVGNQQQMTLKLAVDATASQVFDSGLVPTGLPGTPAILLHLRVPGVDCWKMELTVNATPLMSDWNADGTVSVQDLFDFLQGWFAADGDANEDGVTSLQDVFDFLGAWFAGM